jgi:hypothetical protein
MYYSGQKVVCIDAKPRGDYKWEPGEELEKDKVYTIFKVHESPWGFLILELMELSRGFDTKFYFQLYGYNADRFRPLVDTKTDISIFDEVLNPKQLEEVE